MVVLMIDPVDHGVYSFHRGRTPVQGEVLDASPRGLAVAGGVFSVHVVHMHQLFVSFSAVDVFIANR